MKTRLIVSYDFKSGEDETCCEVLMSGDFLPEDLVHNKFKVFWDNTVCESRSSYYVKDGGYPAVKIRSWIEVPESHWGILIRYLTEI